MGIKGGLNIVNIADNTDNIQLLPGSSSRTSFHAGSFVSLDLPSKLFVQGEILYSRKGYSFPGDPNAIPSDNGVINLNYLNVPLVIGYNIVDKLNIILGPEFGYLVSAQSVFDTESFDIQGAFENFDFGVAGGLQYLVFKKFIIEARYIYGISSIFGDLQITDTNGTPLNALSTNVQNRTFQLSIGYRIK